jgi:hypothetical protein
MAPAFAIIVRSFVSGVEENKSRALFSHLFWPSRVCEWTHTNVANTPTATNNTDSLSAINTWRDGLAEKADAANAKLPFNE